MTLVSHFSLQNTPYVQDDLQKAIFSGCLDSIEEILEEDVDDLLSQRDKRTGSSAIHYATFVGRIDIIRYLIRRLSRNVSAISASFRPRSRS